MDKKVFIFVSSICRRQRLDARKLSIYFLKNSYEITNNPKKADLIFLFTCTFTNKDAMRSLDIVKKFEKYNGELIVLGCLPAIYPMELKEIFNGKTLPTKDFDKIDDFFKNNNVSFKNIPDSN